MHCVTDGFHWFMLNACYWLMAVTGAVQILRGVVWVARKAAL